jgi:hypothetical protein
MTQKQVDMIKEIKENIRIIAGEAAVDKLMEGAEKLKASTNRVKVTEWVQRAMDRLDVTVSKDQSEKIMAACGRNCAKINHKAIDIFQKRRAKYNSLEDFLKAESQSPMRGTKLLLEKDTIVQAYCPSEFSHPMRCYCSLVNELPVDETMSATYCQCSRAFVKQMWEETLGEQVSVTLLKSALSGATECHFRIDFLHAKKRNEAA